MSDRSHDEDAEFAERVGHVLRAPEHLSEDFDRALVAAIRNDQPIAPAMRRRSPMLSRDWWSAPPTLSRAANLALAASLVAIVAFGAWTITPFASPTSRVAAVTPVHDTVTFVRFLFVGQAQSVSLVGDFNQWGATPLPLHTTGSGDTWAASVPVSSGRHEYAFIVNGKHWVADPFAPRESDEFDTNSSVITVGL